MKNEFIVNTQQLADIFGVTTRNIGYMVSNGNMPKHSRGKFNAPECVAWLVEQKTEPEEARDLEEQRFLLCKEQTERESIGNQVRRDELVEIQDVMHLMNEVIAATAGQHDGLAPRLAGELIGQTDPAYIQEQINIELHQIRINLSAAFKTWASSSSHGVDNEAAADEGRRAVG